MSVRRIAQGAASRKVEPDVPVGLGASNVAEPDAARSARLSRAATKSATRTSGATWPVALLLALAVVLFAGGCATVPTEFREPPPLAATEQTTFNRRVFDRAWELVNDRYFDRGFRGVDWKAARERHRAVALAANDTDALYAVLNRMCAELKESHLVALPPRRVHEMRTEHRAAIGIRWQLIEGQRVVTDLVPGGPAARAGVRRGWLVTTRNGAPLREGERFVTHLREPVTFGFLDENGGERTLTLEPEMLSFERRESGRLGADLIYLRFDQFDREALSWLSAELKANAAARGVVLDLRYNSGGNTLVLEMALAEWFERRVPIGRLVRRSGHSRETHSFAWLPAGYRGEVVVLTSSATGSAAEVFSHVLQHHRRATIVGQKTAGAVIYSRTFGLPGGGQLQIPIIDYVGLDGQRLEGRGVMPDVVVPTRTLAQARANHDLEQAKALELLGAAAQPHVAAAAPEL